MNRTLLLLLVLSLCLVASAAVKSQTSSSYESAKVEIDTSKTASYKIPRTIFGTFLEPIGNSTYGGVWADVVVNPSFEEGLWSATNFKKMVDEEPMLVRASELGLPAPWEPLDYLQENRYAVASDAANSQQSLLIMGLPEQETGVRQKIYLPVHRTLHYVGHLSAKHQIGPATVFVSIRRRNRPDEILVETNIALQGADWNSYPFELAVPAKKLSPLEASDFVVSIKGETRVLLDATSLFPSDSIDGMDPDVVSLAKAMRSPLLRFGGNFTSAYHWRDGVGPREKRVSVRNAAWGIPEYNTFGTDEYLHLCELIGARPQIALNLGTGMPEEAADWVRYVNDHWGDKSGGLTWELGNELWGKFQIGYPTLSRVAARTNAAAEAVRRVDPNAVLIGTGGDVDFYHEWNAAQLQNPTAFNYLSTHFVVTTTSMQKKAASQDFKAMASFALPLGLETRLREMHGQIQTVADARDKVKIAFTEWLFWAQAGDAVRYDNMGGAVAAGGFLNMLLRNADIVPLSDMTGIIDFAGIQKERGRVFGAPAYWAFRMYSNADFSTLVETHVAVAKYSVEEGSTRLPHIPDVPYLDVVAALNNSGDVLTIFCVNRYLARDISAEFAVSGFRASSEPSAQTLYATSIYAKNDGDNPEAIRPMDTRVEKREAKLVAVLHPASVTVITLRKTK
jgi:alpha-N-arabinofuranosidase